MGVHLDARRVRAHSQALQAARRERLRWVSTGAVALPGKELGFARGVLVRDPDGHAVLLAEK